jgi:hypothetical protein
MMIDDEVYCINQVFRSKIWVPEYMRNGSGDCTVCVNDVNGNGHCRNYQPIRIMTFDVKENGEYRGIGEERRREANYGK